MRPLHTTLAHQSFVCTKASYTHRRYLTHLIPCECQGRSGIDVGLEWPPLNNLGLCFFGLSRDSKKGCSSSAFGLICVCDTSGFNLSIMIIVPATWEVVSKEADLALSSSASSTKALETTVPSSAAEDSVLPSGENAMCLTQPLCSENVAAHDPSPVLHSRTVLSSDAVAMYFPHGEKRTL